MKSSKARQIADKLKSFQRTSLEPVLDGKDFYVCVPTGMGKTIVKKFTDGDINRFLSKAQG